MINKISNLTLEQQRSTLEIKQQQQSMQLLVGLFDKGETSNSRTPAADGRLQLDQLKALNSVTHAEIRDNEESFWLDDI